MRCQSSKLPARIVFTVTSYFHDTRFVGVLAVLATILAALLGRAFTNHVLALAAPVICHKTILLSGMVAFEFILKLKREVVKDDAFSLRCLADTNRSLGVSNRQYHRFVQLNWVLFTIDADDEVNAGTQRGWSC